MVEPWYTDANGRARSLRTRKFTTKPPGGLGEVDPPAGSRTRPKPAKKTAALVASTHEHEIGGNEAEDWMQAPPAPPPSDEPEDGVLVDELGAEPASESDGDGAMPPPPPDGTEPTDPSDESEQGAPRNNPFDGYDTKALLAQAKFGFFYAAGLRIVGTPRGHLPAPISEVECEQYEGAWAGVIDRYFPAIDHPELIMLAGVTMMGLMGARMGARPAPTPEPEPDETGDDERTDET